MIAYNPEDGSPLVPLASNLADASSISMVSDPGVLGTTVQTVIDSIFPFIYYSLFQKGRLEVYGAIQQKGVTPYSDEITDLVEAIGRIQTQPTLKTKTFDVGTVRSASLNPSDDIDMKTVSPSNFPARYLNTNSVRNYKTGQYSIQGSDPDRVDLGSTNKVSSIQVISKYNKSYSDGQSQIKNSVFCGYSYCSGIKTSTRAYGEEVIMPEDGYVICCEFCNAKASVYPALGGFRYLESGSGQSPHVEDLPNYYGLCRDASGELAIYNLPKGTMVQSFIDATPNWWCGVFVYCWKHS